MKELQLIDYDTGWRFRLICKGCAYSWYEDPTELLARIDTHNRMYLDEVAKVIICRSCKTNRGEITPLLMVKKNHFIGGMA